MDFLREIIRRRFPIRAPPPSFLIPNSSFLIFPAPPPPLLTPNSSFLTSMRRHLPLGRSPYPLSHFAAGVTLAPPLIRFIRFQATQHLRQSWYHKAALPNLCAATFIPNSSFLIFPAPPPSPRVKSVPPEPHRPKDVTLQPLYPFICLILL